MGGWLGVDVTKGKMEREKKDKNSFPEITAGRASVYPSLEEMWGRFGRNVENVSFIRYRNTQKCINKNKNK